MAGAQKALALNKQGRSVYPIATQTNIILKIQGALHSDAFNVFALLPDSCLLAAREHGSGG